MSIYDINYDIKAVEWLPPDKRNPNMVGFIRALFAEIKYLAAKILTAYRTGGSYPSWANGGSYNTGMQVVQKQVVYESLVNGNTTQPPSASWQVYLPSFIGVNDRVKFDSIKITLEYALNERFGANFRQPTITDPLYPHVSDIYITSTPFTFTGFNFGYTTGSSYGRTESSGDIGPSLPFVQPYMFNIMIPVAEYNALNTNGGAVAEISGFVTPLCPVGTTFSITTY